jgi:hypothetical protein
MQRLEVSGAVRPLKWPLGVKWLREVHNVRLRMGKNTLLNKILGPKQE